MAWIADGTEYGVRITSAIPAVFEAYATLELPGTGDQKADRFEELQERHDTAVLEVLSAAEANQPWWLGYLETGVSNVVFDDAPRVKLYAGWPYVLVEASAEEAAIWRQEGEDWSGKGVLPDMMFPADRSWLVSTLWDDDWTCIGGSRALIDAVLSHPDLRARAREVDPSLEDATPPGHVAF